MPKPVRQQDPDATPEQVAGALLRNRRPFLKPWLRLEIERNGAGIPLIVGITEHDERPPPS